ncbi:DNA-binding protein [Circinella umbellata]|nr:DNA-binding protein [Circinella umbellata]
MISRQDLINLLLDFIEVWIHQILYERELYPTAIFSLKKKYDVPVQMATHEGVASYISKFVESLQTLLISGNCKLISLKIMSPVNNRILERFVFEIESALNESNLDIPLDTILDSEVTCSLADIQQQLRACLLRTTATRSSLANNPSDCTFTLGVETYSGSPSSTVTTTRQQVDWIPTQIDQQEFQQHQRWNHIIPIKTIPMDLFKINVFVIEAIKKGKHVSR